MNFVQTIKRWWINFVAGVIITIGICLIIAFFALIYWLDHLRFEL